MEGTKMTKEEAVEWVKTHTEKDILVRSELEAAYQALVCCCDVSKSDAGLWSDHDLWLFCCGEVHPPTSIGPEPPMCIADIRDVLVKLGLSGILTRECSHACLRAASMLVRLRLAIFFRDYDPRAPITDSEAAAAYSKIREVILAGE